MLELVPADNRHRARHCNFLFFFNATATTEIYTLSLHDALPISAKCPVAATAAIPPSSAARIYSPRSEEHTSELQSRVDLVCRLLLEKKNVHHRLRATHKAPKQAREALALRCPPAGRLPGLRGKNQARRRRLPFLRRHPRPRKSRAVRLSRRTRQRSD